MVREIKFKRAYFFDEECKNFSHYSEWGVGIKDSTFTSPSQNNYAPYYIDYQFTGFIAEKFKTNLEKEIYAGDIFRGTKETNEGDIYLYHVVVWVRQRGAFYMIPKDCYEDFMLNDLSEDPDFSWLFEDAQLYDFSIDVGLTKVGNIHEREVKNG